MVTYCVDVGCLHAEHALNGLPPLAVLKWPAAHLHVVSAVAVHAASTAWPPWSQLRHAAHVSVPSSYVWPFTHCTQPFLPVLGCTQPPGHPLHVVAACEAWFW